MDAIDVFTTCGYVAAFLAARWAAGAVLWRILPARERAAIPNLYDLA